VLLALLTIGTFTGAEIIIRIAGAVGIITGGGAFYIACAEMLNEQYKKPVLPL
jgi:hypothetical protein